MPRKGEVLGYDCDFVHVGGRRRIYYRKKIVDTRNVNKSDIPVAKRKALEDKCFVKKKEKRRRKKPKKKPRKRKGRKKK